MIKLEEEAAAFKRSKEAEKKARQRAGLKFRPIVVHDEICIPTLVAMGFLRDADIEDDAAINEAFAKFIRHYCHNVRYSKLTGWEASARIWHEERGAEWKERDRRHLKRLEEGGFYDGGIHPDHDKPMPYIKRPGDNRPSKVSDLPRMKVDRKRGGTPTGRNPSLTTATIYNARGMVLGKWRGKSQTPAGLGKIEKLSDTKVRAEEKAIERIHGRLTPPDKSVHTLSLGGGEAEAILDHLEWQGLGYAKRKSKLPTMDRQEKSQE